MLSTEARDGLITNRFQSAEAFYQWLLANTSLTLFIKQLKLSDIDASLIIEALTHSTFLNETELKLTSFERLEFLGDSVIDLIVSQALFEKFPMATEGELSKRRAMLVNAQSLNQIALANDWQSYLLTGKTFTEEAIANHPKILSDSLEALLGAVYLANGLERASEIFLQLLAKYEEKENKSFYAQDEIEQSDPKGSLQEFLVKNFGEYPEYLAFESTPGNFTVSLKVKDVILMSMEGDSKKKCERMLASEILKNKEQLFSIMKERLC